MILSCAFREFICLSALLNRPLYCSRHCCFCQRKCFLQRTDSRTRRLPSESYTSWSSILCGFLCASKEIVGVSESSNSCPLCKYMIALRSYVHKLLKQQWNSSSVGRALHWYLGVYGFKSRSGLIFSGFNFTAALVCTVILRWSIIPSRLSP